MEKITEKFHDDDSPSSSESDDQKSPSQSSVKANINRLFGREKPLHKLLGGENVRKVFITSLYIYTSIHKSIHMQIRVRIQNSLIRLKLHVDF